MKILCTCPVCKALFDLEVTKDSVRIDKILCEVCDENEVKKHES